MAGRVAFSPITGRLLRKQAVRGGAPGWVRTSDPRFRRPVASKINGLFSVGYGRCQPLPLTSGLDTAMPARDRSARAVHSDRGSSARPACPTPVVRRSSRPPLPCHVHGRQDWWVRARRWRAARRDRVGGGQRRLHASRAKPPGRSARARRVRGRGDVVQPVTTAGSPPPVRLATCIRHPALTRIEQRVAAYRIYL